YFFVRKYRVTLSWCNRSSTGEMTPMQWESTPANTLYFIIAINVTLLQQALHVQISEMQFGGRGYSPFRGVNRRRNRNENQLAKLFAELGDSDGQSRHFAARRIAMPAALLCRAHDDRLSLLERRERLGSVAGCDRFLDLAHELAHLRPPRLVDLGASGDFAGRLAGGRGIGHACARLAGL